MTYPSFPFWLGLCVKNIPCSQLPPSPWSKGSGDWLLSCGCVCMCVCFVCACVGGCVGGYVCVCSMVRVYVWVWWVCVCISVVYVGCVECVCVCGCGVCACSVVCVDMYCNVWSTPTTKTKMTVMNFASVLLVN